MGKITPRNKGPKAPGAAPGGKKSPGKSPQQQPNKPLNTSKGQFTFTMVTDGCYIEHKWGQNSGHVGVPLEAIPNFIQRLQAMYQKATGVNVAAKSPKGPGGPKSAITKKKEGKTKEAQKKEKKAPPPKKSMEDLDAELMNYTAARSAGDAEVAEAAPAPA